MNRALLPAGAAALAAAALVAGALVAPEPAYAICSVLSHHPCTPYFGSVLRRGPFTPYSCGVTGGPCSPEVVLMVGDVPVLKVKADAGPPEPVDPGHPVEHLNDIGPLLSQCLALPTGSDAQAGMETALRFAFKRNGELLADPRFTYTTHGAPENVKAAYHAAALDMLRRCTPLPVTADLGGAIAGHPFVVAIKDTRDLKVSGAPAAPADAKP